jgi:hypothetical protein
LRSSKRIRLGTGNCRMKRLRIYSALSLGCKFEGIQ